VDDKFRSLPPPKPSSTTPSYGGYGGGYGGNTSSSISTTSTANIDMSYYHSSGNVCFDGNCQVLMGDKSLKKVENIKKGDLIYTPNGDVAQIECVVKTCCANSKASLVELEGGLFVTPWHPVRLNGVWKFPSDIGIQKERDCPAVYNFVLDKEHVIMINGVECVTLGHGMKGSVVEHNYFGSQIVLDDLKSCEGWEQGFVVLDGGNALIRDKETGLVRGIVRTSIRV